MDGRCSCWVRRGPRACGSARGGDAVAPSIPHPRPLWRSGLFLHLYFLSRLPGLDIESSGDLRIISCFGAEESGGLNFSGQTLTSVNLATPRFSGKPPGQGWAQRKNMWDFALSLTLKPLCPWISHHMPASVQLRAGSVCLGGPSWL